MDKVISRESLDRLIDVTDPADVLSYFGVPYTGNLERGLKSACPLHGGDNTGALSWDVRTKWFTCFTRGCCTGRPRDVITFTMELGKLNFSEAVSLVASIAGIEVTTEQQDNIKTYEYEYYVSKNRQENFQKDKYSLEKLHSVTINNYVEGGKEFFSQYLSYRNYTEDDVRPFCLYPGADKYGNLRLYIPILDETNALVGLTGRQMTPLLSYPDVNLPNGKVKPSPRYDNFVEFKKAKILYNLNRAKQFADRGLIIVEGQLDVIRMNKYGYPNTVAMMGSILSAQQIMLLYKHTSSVTLLVEESEKLDKKGEKSNMKALGRNIKELTFDMGRPLGLGINVALLPDTDPDSSTADQIKTALANTQKVVSTDLFVE